MKNPVCLDLGRLEGPVLIFGGPYSNRHATAALIAQAARHQVVPGNAICTGDLVAYCAEGAETVAAIRGFAAHVVAGNCERQLAAGAADCGCGFGAGTACDRLAAGWFAHADATLGPDERGWMAGLPDILTFRHNGRRCAVVHGGATDIARFIWPVSPEQDFRQEIAATKSATGPVDMIFSGHSGVPFTRVVDDVTWVNAGAIGMPPHDGRAETRFCLLYGENAMIHRLSYDHAGAAAAMEAAGLTQGYHRALTTGIWPSEDVLPVAMCRNLPVSGAGGG